MIRLLTENEITDFVNIVFNAYPKVFDPSEENRRKINKRFTGIQTSNPSQNFYGLYREGQMLGGMQLHNFIMKLLSIKIPVGGVGSVAVDFLHKKENVCKELITYFLNHYRNRGYGMVALYPFRPNFYKRMGFGYGSKMNRYKTKPAFLPEEKAARKEMFYLSIKDINDMVECHNRLVDTTHGMIEKTAIMVEKIFDDPENRVVGYKQDGKLRAYLVYRFVSDDDKRFLIYDMYIEEIIYENAQTLKILLAFLRSQADQVRDIIIDTHDEYFHYLLSDPRNGSNNFLGTLSHESNLQGLGIMYRVVNVTKIFESLHNHNFGGQNCKMRLSINDDFLSCNNTSITIQFQEGIAEIKESEDYEVEVSFDISGFSSLIMGTVNFNTLYRYGLAKISDKGYIGIINKIFMTDEKPKCTVRF
nr:GNAT family N-acetyltransferase [Sporomusa ovata]